MKLVIEYPCILLSNYDNKTGAKGKRFIIKLTIKIIVE